jgi:hypothetical protein
MAALSKIIAKLSNEPILKRFIPLVVSWLLAVFVAWAGWIDPTVYKTITAALGAAAVPIILSARNSVYGPVTFQRATNPDTHPEIPSEYHGKG